MNTNKQAFQVKGINLLPLQFSVHYLGAAATVY